MTSVAGGYRPPLRKMAMYAAIVLALLGLCSGYLLVIHITSRQSAQRVLHDWAEIARAQVIRASDLKIKELKLQLLNLDVAGLADDDPAAMRENGRLLSLLSTLEEQNPGHGFYFIDAAGTMFDRDGDSLGRAISRHVLNRVIRDDMALTEFYDAKAGKREVAEIVTLYPGARQFLARSGNIEDYARDILAGLGLFGDYFGFYDSERKMTAELIKTEAGAAPRVRSEIEQKAARFYQANRRADFLPVGFGPNFDIFILMDDTEGWVFGARVQASQLMPFFYDMMLSALVIFLVILALVVLVILLDIINDRERAAEKLRLACRDPLTGLYNEVGAQRVLRDHLLKGTTADESLVAFDIVSFRRFNSMFGYAAGDKLLRVVAGVLAAHCRLGVRVYADLFVCLLDGASGGVESLDNRLDEAIREEVGRQYLQMVKFKYGIYRFTNRSHSLGEVYDSCMLALRSARHLPGRRWTVYDATLHQKAELQKNIEVNMLSALSRDEFKVFIQPKYDAALNRCAGGEALVRWLSEKSGMITPDSFIPLFERNGFIVELDFFMLSKVLGMLQRQVAAGVSPLPVSVNQSRATICFPNYLDRLEKLLAGFDVPLRHLELEITENCLEEDFDAVVKLMHILKEKGLRISMDDFGSGYSSLNTLRELPVDVLKLDREFLRHSDVSERGRTIIKSTINLARDLGISVICEGVETREQFDFLTECGCTLIQGYYYSRPMPADQFEETYLDLPDTRTG